MRTLIVHPDDRSTDFLKPIYQNLKDTTIINCNIDLKQYSKGLNQAIDEHDRVIMMGHGSPQGLFGLQAFNGCNFIVNRYNVEALSKKDNNVFIWCNADQFVEQYKLKGFYTGMFISEVSEAAIFNIVTTQTSVDESNNSFAVKLGTIINKPLQETYKSLVEDYSKIANNNSVAYFNSQRLYLK